MSLKYGKTEIAAMIAVLDEDHASIEEAAKAALGAAEEIFEKRASFVVVGQVVETKEKGRLEEGDPDAVKVSLGWYSTEGDAITAAESLWASTASGDILRCWVLPVFHGSPAAFHLKQQAKYKAAEEKRAEKLREKALANIEKRREAMEERARGGKGSCLNCGHEPYDHRPHGQQTRHFCALTGCECEGWKEKAA